MGKELTKVAQNDLTELEMQELALFEAEKAKAIQAQQTNVSSKDILIAKILAMQGQSVLVIDGKAKFGDFVNSLTEEVVGDIVSGISFTPIHMTKMWIVKKRKDDDWEYSHMESAIGENSMLPVAFQEDDIAFKRKLCYKFYGFLGGDLSMPVVIDFKGASVMTGAKLVTQAFVLASQRGELCYENSYIIGGEKKKSEKATYVALTIKPENKTDMRTVLTSRKWSKILQENEKSIKERDIPESNVSEPF